MKKMRKPTDLIDGPYRAPKYRIGDRLVCARWQGAVEVIAMSDAPIPWPLCCPRRGKPSLILTGDLERAVRTESAAAIMKHFGVSESTAILFRSVLGVTDRNCPGTQAARALRAGTYSTAGHAQPARK